MASQAIASTAKYNLLVGIAHYYIGNHVDALSFLKSAQKLKAELPTDLGIHLEYFLISVKHSLGLCTDADYMKKIDVMEDADGVGLYIKIEKAKTGYYTNLSDSSADKFDKLLKEIQAILSHPKADNGLKYLAESELVLIRGSKNNWEYITNITAINAAETVTGPDKAIRLDAFARFTESYDSWVLEVHRVKDETLKEKNYFHYLHTVLNEVKVIYEMTVFIKAVSIENSFPGMPELKIIDQQSLFGDLLEKLAMALQFYRQIGHIENEVVALSLQFELEHYLGDFAKANETISEAENLSDTYELTEKKRRLNHLKNKGTTHE